MLFVICCEVSQLVHGEEEENGYLTNALQRSRWGAAVAAPRSRGLLSAHVLLLVLLLLIVVRFAAGHVLLLFLLGWGWFAGERHRVPRPNLRNAASAMKLA